MFPHTYFSPNAVRKAASIHASQISMMCVHTYSPLGRACSGAVISCQSVVVMTVAVVHRLSPSLPPPRPGYAASSGKWKFRLPPPRHVVEWGMARGKDSILFQPHLTKLLLATLVQCTRGIQNNATVRFTAQSITL